MVQTCASILQGQIYLHITMSHMKVTDRPQPAPTQSSRHSLNFLGSKKHEMREVHDKQLEQMLQHTEMLQLLF